MSARIPGDWSQHSVGDVIEFQGGSQPEKNLFSATPRPGFVRLIQIRDYKSDKFEVFAPVELLRRFCDENDIMIGRYGPPVFQILRGLSGAYNVALIKAVPRPPIDRNFAFYFLKQDSLFEFIEKLSRRSSGQTGVDLSELRQYPIPLPPLPEQRAIATALSDVDALLAKLDQLITKKRNLKQAAMQQLLTGQTRLPGFSGKWRDCLLGEVISHCFSGATPYRGQSDFYRGDIRWITSGELNYNVIFDTFEKISPDAVVKTNLKIVPTGTFLMAITGLEAEGTRGSCGIVGAPSATNQSCMAVFPTSELLTEYLFHYYVFNGKSLALQYCQGTKQQSYTAKIVKLLPIPLPPTTSEQTAIATLLSDMDAELAALEARREKTRALKQGMMQELLTGRIRLLAN